MYGNRAPLIGIRRPIRRKRFSSAGFSVSFTGLSADSLGAYGQIGTHASIGFTATASGAPIVPDSWKWSADPSPAGAATFGTSAAPTDFAAADGFSVYLHVVALGETITRAFPVRRAPGAFAALVAQTFTEATGPQTYTFAAATGTGLTWTYSLVSAPAGVTLVDRTVTVDTAALAPQVTAYTVRATDQYGRTIDQVGALTINAAPVVGATAPGIVQPGSWSLAATAPGIVQPDSWSLSATAPGAVETSSWSIAL